MQARECSRARVMWAHACVYACMYSDWAFLRQQRSFSSPREAVGLAGLQRGPLRKPGLVRGCLQSWVGGWMGPEGRE